MYLIDNVTILKSNSIEIFIYLHSLLHAISGKFLFIHPVVLPLPTMPSDILNILLNPSFFNSSTVAEDLPPEWQIIAAFISLSSPKAINNSEIYSFLIAFE